MWKSLSLLMLTVTAIGAVSLFTGCNTAKARPEQVSLSTNPEGKLALVKNSRSTVPIVIFKDAPPRTRNAADELATYIEKISGAKPEVIAGKPDPVPEHAIWVGYQPIMDDLFPDLDFDFHHPEEILIAANDDHLAIAGRDRWDPDNLTRKGRRSEVHGVQKEYGTVNAVYTFLQEYLEVRWLWPGELGEDIREHDTIAFEPFEYRYHPQIRARAGIFAYSVLGYGYGRAHQWSRFQRLLLDSLQVPGGHGFKRWWDKFHETHPEYFALQPDGTRGGGKDPFPGAHTVKMCLSNPQLWEQWVETNVDDVLDRNPLHRVFDASENDSWASGYCICEHCREWDHPEGERRSFRWEGIGQKYVAMSERQVKCANQLGRLLKERYPDKEYYVKIMAYGHSRPPPVEAVPDDNVLVASVALFLLQPDNTDRASSNGTLHRDQFREWAQVTENMVWRPNTPGTSTPLLPLSQTIEDFQFVAENNCKGLFIDRFWEHWATRGPLYYIVGQMTWNPRQDGEAMLDDYFNRGFGKAAGEIHAYWRFMEQKWRESRDGSPKKELLDADFFDKAYGFLDDAVTAVEGEPVKYRKRIEFVKVGLDYTKWLTKAREMMIRVQKSGGDDKEAEARAREIWVDKIYPLATNEEYTQALRWGRITPGSGNMDNKNFYPEDLHRKGQKWWEKQ